MVYFLALSQHYETTSGMSYFIIDNGLPLVYAIKQTLA